MLIAYATIGVLLVALIALTQRRADPWATHREARETAWRQLRPLLLRLPFALVAATLLAVLLPAEYVARIFGEGAGASGVITASVLGAVLPGGPMVAFPLAVALFEAGAGWPQMIALLTAWAVLALHRVVAFELALVGWRFALGRLAAAAVTPFVAGFLALALL